MKKNSLIKCSYYMHFKNVSCYILILNFIIYKASIDDIKNSSIIGSTPKLDPECIGQGSKETNTNLATGYKGVKRKINFDEYNEQRKKSVDNPSNPEKKNLKKTSGYAFNGYTHLLNDATLYKQHKYKTNNQNFIFFKLAVLSDDILKSDLGLALTYDEMKEYYNKNIKNIVIPPEILDLIKPEIFLFSGNEVKKSGIINSETCDILNRDFTDKPIFSKIVKSIEVLNIYKKNDNKEKVEFMSPEICYDNIHNIQRDILTNEIIKNIDKIYRVKIKKIILPYKDIKLLNDEIKTEYDLKKILSNFKYEINMDSDNYSALEDHLIEVGIKIPDIFYDPITYHQLNQTAFYDQGNHNRFINRSTLHRIYMKHPKDRCIESDIEILQKENLYLIKNWRAWFKMPSFNKFFNYVEKEILTFGSSPEIDFDPNEENSSQSYLEKKYIYLYLYHQHLKKLIERLDKQNIKKFVELCINNRKEKRIQKISEYKNKRDEEMLKDICSYYKNLPLHESEKDYASKEIRYKAESSEEKYKSFFPDFESELKYEIENFSRLLELLKERMEKLFPSKIEYEIKFERYREYRLDSRIEGLCEIQLQEVFLNTYRNSFIFETDCVHQNDFLLRLDYEYRRVFELKNRLETENLVTKSTNYLSKTMADKIKDFYLKVEQEKINEYRKEIEKRLIEMRDLKDTFEMMFQLEIKVKPELKYRFREEEFLEILKYFECKKEIETEFMNNLKEKLGVKSHIINYHRDYPFYVNLHTKKLMFPNHSDLEKDSEFLNELRRNFKKNVGENLDFIIDINITDDDKKSNNLIKINY